MDAIRLITHDHAAVERLFKQFERAERSGKNAEMRRAVRAFTKALSIHAAIEEQALYPALRRSGEEVEDEVLEALEEHHLVKLTLAELDAMSPTDERYRAKVAVLIENVRHHVEEEESELLPRLRSSMSARDLRDLGEALATLEKAAPTRPHPASPDTPPGNLLVGPVAAIYDRGRDAVRELAKRGTGRAREAVHGGKRSLRGMSEGVRKRARSASKRGRAAAEAITEDRPTVH